MDKKMKAASFGSMFWSVLGVLTCTVAVMALAEVSLAVDETATPTGKVGETVWTTGDALMPGWGLYPNADEYGDTKPLGGKAAWTPRDRGWLTWVVKLPVGATYQVFVRRYVGYGQVTVEIDECAVTSGKGILEPGSGRYSWFHLGKIFLKGGQHHVDIHIQTNMFDAVLLTTDAAFDPAHDTLPEPVQVPQRFAPRRYRDASALAARGGLLHLAIGPANPNSVDPRQQQLNDYVAPADSVLDRLSFWGATGQYVPVSFSVRALHKDVTLRVTLSELIGPNGWRLGVEDIDPRVVHVRERYIKLFTVPQRKGLCADLLLRDDRTALPPKGKQGGFGGGVCVSRIPSHESRQYQLTVHIRDGSPPGVYKGILQLESEDSPVGKISLPVVLDVLPVDLKPVEGYYGIYYPSKPLDANLDRVESSSSDVSPQPARSSTEAIKGLDVEFPSRYVSPQRYLAELKDQVRHGLNSTTLYGGFPTLRYAKQAGMSEAPVVMHWPGDSAHEEVEAARKMGFNDLYYYGVDEPHGERIERCGREAERRMKLGLHMFTAINSLAAWQGTKDFIDRPVYNIYVFGGRDAEAATHAQSRGFRPISYWGTEVSFPLWYRALSGLYNTACGYQGTAPWAYQDFRRERVYHPHPFAHAVTYPDEDGNPITTLRWESFRDGVDDVRYLQALDRAIASAEARLKQPDSSRELAEALAAARKVRRETFESIEGRWFEYLCGLTSDTLDVSRRKMAEAIVAIEGE